jgi:hypothetical protein
MPDLVNADLAAHTPMMQQCVLTGVDLQMARKLRRKLRQTSAS